MINQVYRLVSPRQFEVAYKDRSLKSERVVVRPTHLSICAADQRYYTGTRGEEAIAKKLPMALIHEGIGKVVYDPKKEYPVGTRVVMIPNTPTEEDELIAENYLRTSKFRSSGYDGFMQDYAFLKRDRIVPLFEGMNPYVGAFLELISVSMHAITRYENKAHVRRNTLGVWGDGNLGFITSLLLKKKYPDSKVIIFGKTKYKLDHFSFVDESHQIDKIPTDLHIDHAFECVGGNGSGKAINQIIDYINPEGSIAILGVSENPIEINTRMILEKGLTVIGSSRSGRKDFVNSVNFLSEHTDVCEYLETMVGSTNVVNNIQDVINVFEKDLTTSWGKTIIEWNV
ncbi:ribitol-5-phosphate dehydrogenase [Camelliibacillus cellulosilyticus]|uniref:Ribulose-5-phosphate reductase n=1 Tax=Camelliibacillus cellulosilyticus TaxID=2174486 RepID=A0ABV9GT46_9BACL